MVVAPFPREDARWLPNRKVIYPMGYLEGELVMRDPGAITWAAGRRYTRVPADPSCSSRLPGAFIQNSVGTTFHLTAAPTA